MTNRKLFYNGRIYTQAGDNLIADSMAIDGHQISAIGRNLQNDPDFASYNKCDLKKMTVIPGLVDSHTHLHFIAISMGTVKLDNLYSIEEVLNKIKRHSAKFAKEEWVIGEGISPDRWNKYVLPDKFMLDKVTGGRPAAIFSKDQHLAWVNSKALELAGINNRTQEPTGGSIIRLDNNEPSGILKEIPAYFPVFRLIKGPKKEIVVENYRKLLKELYSKGITGAYSFDGPDAFAFFSDMSKVGKLGLRIEYYAPNKILPLLKEKNIGFGYGNDYFRVAGVKIFSDGSLGSQSALCFKKYNGSENNFGIEATSPKEMLRLITAAAKLDLPCAIHAIGDRAVANVLDCFEKAPALKGKARHRIEHLQLIRRSDIKRLKKLNITASMQPSHCPSDIKLIRKYWPTRSRDCFIFRTLLDNGINLAFGSDAPIEPLGPIAGIAAAVNRIAPGERKSFHPEQKISPLEALYQFTAGAAYSAGREDERGFLLPGYKADFVIISNDIGKISPRKIADIKILATFFDGNLVFKDKTIKLSL